jgi:CubicO group peptidase (beta-lactamase class C family)
MKAGGTVGLTIALVDGDRTVLVRGFGWADQARRVPVTARTLFHVGSISKTLSAAAVMQLVQEGRVNLDAPVSRYVPLFSLTERFPGSVITVRSVLDHHSGIPATLANGLFTENKPDPGYRAWLLKTLSEEYPERPVNTAWAYNNSGYVLLQNLVENVTHEGFAAYTHQHLFAPMGMPSTTFNDASVPASQLTDNYQAVAHDGAFHDTKLPREYVNGWAAGSVLSSASDMTGYLKAMIGDGAVPGGRILHAATVKEMITPQTDLPLDIAPFRMGLGWWVGESALSWMGTVIHHAGHTLANHSEMMWIPGSNVGVFVSVNTDSPVNVENQVASLALGLMVTAKTGRTPPPAPHPSPVLHVSPVTLHREAGLYASANGINRISVAGDALSWTPAVQDPKAHSFTMTPRADGWYTSDAPGLPSIKFVTVVGRDLMLARAGGGAVSQIAAGAVGAAAERIPATYHLPAAWRSRLGSYRAINITPNAYPGAVAAEGSLGLFDGILVWHASPAIARATGVLVPASSDLAFTYGFSPFAVENDAGDEVAAGPNTLTILGVTYRRTGSS